MKKEINEKKGFLLGKDKSGFKVWLAFPSFNCGWYWGFGYIQQYNNRNSMTSHSHFDYLFLKKDIFDGFKNYFIDTTLSNSEIWQLLELMKTFYIMREYSDTLNRGGSHITSNPLKDMIKNDNEYKRINNEIMPAIFEEIKKLLTGEEA